MIVRTIVVHINILLTYKYSCLTKLNLIVKLSAMHYLTKYPTEHKLNVIENSIEDGIIFN